MSPRVREYTSSELANLPPAALLEAWRESITWDNDSRKLEEHYPNLNPEHLELAFDAVSRNCKAASVPFSLLFDFGRKIMRNMIADDEFVPLIAPIEAQPAVHCLRDGCIAVGMVDPAINGDWLNNGFLWLEFNRRWTSIDHPDTYDAFSLAENRAKAKPIELIPAKFGSLYVPELIPIASIAYHLQVSQGDDEILMPRERIGELFGLKGQSARNLGTALIGPLKQAELLRKVRSHKPCEVAEGLRFDFKRTDIYKPPSE